MQINIKKFRIEFEDNLSDNLQYESELKYEIK